MPARHQQLAVVFLVPNQAAPVHATEQVFLMVGHLEDTVAHWTQLQDGHSIGKGS